MSGTIGRDEMYRLLLEALPEFAVRWARRQEESNGDPRALPEYPPLEEISRYASYETQHRRALPIDAYRDALALLQRRGEPYVRSVARDLAADLSAAPRM